MKDDKALPEVTTEGLEEADHQVSVDRLGTYRLSISAAAALDALVSGDELAAADADAQSIIERSVMFVITPMCEHFTLDDDEHAKAVVEHVKAGVPVIAGTFNAVLPKEQLKQLKELVEHGKESYKRWQQKRSH